MNQQALDQPDANQPVVNLPTINQLAVNLPERYPKPKVTLQKLVCQCGLTGALLLMGAALPPAYGETVQVPIGRQAQDKWTMDRPVTGMSKAQVQSFFGDPVEAKGAIGEPPISRWVYEDFVVYFEYDHVVHTVLKYSAEAQQQAKVQSAQ